MTPVRVLVADDHIFYREGVKRLLADHAAEVLVVGEAANGEEAVALTRELEPDVVLMDLRMPGLHGIEATRQILTDLPGTAVLVLTMHDDDSVLAAVRAGARGYLLKDVGVTELVRAIGAVHAGESIFGESPAQRIGAYLSRPQAAGAVLFPGVTDRELEVLRLVAAGWDNRQIARQVHLSDKTVRNYVASLQAKLQVHTRAGLVARARDAGLTP